MYENIYFKLWNGYASFWFDNWLKSGPWTDTTITRSQQTNLQIKDCLVDNLWDEGNLTNLVGSNKTVVIMQLTVRRNSGSDVFIWKPTPNENFTMAWEITRQATSTSGWRWVWHKMLPIFFFFGCGRHYLTISLWKKKFDSSTFLYFLVVTAVRTGRWRLSSCP